MSSPLERVAMRAARREEHVGTGCPRHGHEDAFPGLPEALFTVAAKVLQ